MSHKKLRIFIVKVSVLGYFPLLDYIIITSAHYNVLPYRKYDNIQDISSTY